MVESEGVRHNILSTLVTTQRYSQEQAREEITSSGQRGAHCLAAIFSTVSSK